MSDASGWILSNLPSDILGLILSTPASSFLLLRLWKCGDLLLNAKLSAGVTSVDLRHSPVLDSRFPLLLVELLKLRSLSLHSDAAGFALPRMMSQLPKLSKELHELEMSGPWASSFLKPTFVLPPNHDADCAPVLTSLRGILPSLQTLRILNTRQTPDLLGAIPFLPSSLTCLGRMHIEISHSHRNIMSVLPRTLVRFEASIHFVFRWTTTNSETKALINAIKMDWAQAPPNLQHIDQILCQSCPDSWDWLPKSLLSADIGGFNWNASSMPSFPSVCTTLKNTIHRDSLDFQNIKPPPHLTDIQLSATEISGANIAELPRRLTRLVIHNSQELDWRVLLPPEYLENRIGSMKPPLKPLDWPPHLSVLILSPTSLHQNPLAHLPTTITDLKLIFWRPKNRVVRLNANIFGGGGLSSNLKRLELQCGSNEGYLSFEIIGTLPSSLHSLIIKAKSENGAMPRTQIETAFPESLTELELTHEGPHNRKLGSWDVPLKLPSRLTSLKISELASGWLSTLPHTLVKLDLTNLIIPLLTQKVIEMDVFQGLPPNLTYLSIFTSNRHHPDVPDEAKVNTMPLLSFSQTKLPQLRVLLLSSQLTRFPTSTVANLPRGLQQLSINFADSIYFVDLLPTGLVDLKINGTSVFKLTEQNQDTEGSIKLRERLQLLYH